MDSYARYLPIFRPRVVAVVGASASGATPGNEFIRHSRAFGYDGRMVPIHPSASSVEGLPAAKSFAEVGEPRSGFRLRRGRRAACAGAHRLRRRKGALRPGDVQRFRRSRGGPGVGAAAGRGGARSRGTRSRTELPRGVFTARPALVHRWREPRARHGRRDHAERRARRGHHPARPDGACATAGWSR